MPELERGLRPVERAEHRGLRLTFGESSPVQVDAKSSREHYEKSNDRAQAPNTAAQASDVGLKVTVRT
jgi:hypothetical protein